MFTNRKDVRDRKNAVSKSQTTVTDLLKIDMRCDTAISSTSFRSSS